MEDVDYPEPTSSEYSEIEALKAEVLVHSARASNLHTRLLHAFDALDESQRNHAQELRDLEKKYIRLERRYHRQTVALHTCAAEKDDLRESVLELVEKVEQSNDIRSWPFNRLQLTRSAGSPRRIDPNVRHSPTQEHLNYAGAIIERLRRERDEERVEHALTREALQSRIDALEARLARRETELEYYNTYAAHRSPALERNRAENIGSTSSYGLLDSIPQVMTNEDIIQMLNTTAARNRTLEGEIKTLFKRLHEARSLPVSTEAASPPLQPAHQIPVYSPLSRGFEGTGTRLDAPSDRTDVLSPRSKHDAYELSNGSLFTPTPLSESTPVSDEIDDHHGGGGADGGSYDDIDPDSWANLPLATPTSGGESAKGYINSGVGVGDDRSSCSNLPEPLVLGVHAPNRNKFAIIAGLDMELEELTAQIDAFRLERENLTRMVAARREYRETQCYGQTSGESSSSLGSGSSVVRRVGDDASVRPSLEAINGDAVECFEDGNNQDKDEEVLTERLNEDDFEYRLNVVEGDCDQLRNELIECRTSAEIREKGLLVEIQDLQRRVEELASTPSHVSFIQGENERGTQSDVEYLIDDDSSLFDPTPTLIPDTRSKIKDDGDPHSTHLHFGEPVVDFVNETGGQQSSAASSEADIAQLSTTSRLDLTRETEGLKLGDLELERLLDVVDGEAPMVLATPIVPASLLDRDSSDESTVAATMENSEAGHDGIWYDHDIDRDRREEEEDMELAGMSDGIDYDDDDPNEFGHDFVVGVGVDERDSHSSTISDDDDPASPSVNYSSSRETSIDDDGDGEDCSGHSDRSVFDDDIVNPVEHQVPRDHGDQQDDHERDQEE